MFNGRRQEECVSEMGRENGRSAPEDKANLNII